jgi:hypothetical protein
MEGASTTIMALIALGVIAVTLNRIPPWLRLIIAILAVFLTYHETYRYFDRAHKGSLNYINHTILAQQIDWPLKALKFDKLSETPTETVAAKFAAFQDELQNKYGIALRVYIAPKIADQVITGWKEHEGTALPIVKASIDDTVRLFCELSGFSYEIQNGIILIK